MSTTMSKTAKTAAIRADVAADKFTATAVLAQRDPKSVTPAVESKKFTNTPLTCSHIFSKDGSLCAKPVLKLAPISERQKNLGVPCDSNGFTGSNDKCERHVIFEKYWPWCTYCQDLKVAFDSKGITAGYCYMCINNKYHLNKPGKQELKNSLLDCDEFESSFLPSTTWATKITTKPVTKKELLNDEDFPQTLSPVKSVKVEALLTDAVKEKNRIVAEKRIAFAASEADLKKTLDDEERRITSEHSVLNKQRAADTKASLAASFAVGFNDRQSEILLDFITQQRFLRA